jgi:SAM-dependent MidA family methyltransferase
MRFDRFMDQALYHPEFGYYRKARDPFGIAGDFYTASQFQPEFGDLLRIYIEQLLTPAARSPVRLADLGAGRGEMRTAFACFEYLPVEHGEVMPEGLQIVFANEFFDALPVRAGVMKDGSARELLVEEGGGELRWHIGNVLDVRSADSVAKYWAPRAEGDRFEISDRSKMWMERAAASIDDGWLIAIDYGHTMRETARFSAGTLMSYRRHTASDQVLLTPGERDITAHVSFDALTDYAREAGFENVAVRTLGSVVMDALSYEPYLQRGSVGSRQRVKALLYGLGETFRVLVARKKVERK